MADFKSLKRNSTSQFDKLNQELSKLNQSSYSKDDEKYWQCQTDKAGNGFAIIRFLPAAPVDGDDAMPFVRMWTHGFKAVGGWYIENSLTTINKDDPIGEYNSKLWNTGLESDKTQARDQKRKLSYHSNIYVVKDPANPENEGKVFLFRYGKKIFDKLNEMMNPPEDPIDPKEAINPFSFWEGANFKLKIRKVEGYANYDKSEFEAPSPLLNDDDELEVIWKKQHSLKDIVDLKNFKTYAELKARMDKVLGFSDSGTTSRKRQDEDHGETLKESSEPAERESFARDELESSVDEVDADLDFFRKLAEED